MAFGHPWPGNSARRRRPANGWTAHSDRTRPWRSVMASDIHSRAVNRALRRLH